MRLRAQCLSLSVTAWFCAVSPAQQLPVPAPAPAALRVGGGILTPLLLSRQEPAYTEEARAAGLQGTVVVGVTIGEDGRPRNLRVEKSLGLGLDENALAAVSNGGSHRRA